MRHGVRALVGTAAAFAVFGTACSESSRVATAPVRADTTTSSNRLGGLLGTVIDTVTSLLVSPVNRTAPLAEDVTWTFTAGPEGGYSSNSAVGLTIYVPDGALSARTTFTVTALKGSAVAYRFEPHTKFERKVTLRQSLGGTTAGGLLDLPLKGAHFEGDRLTYTSDGLVSVTEIVAALVNLWTKSASFGVDHFSGWVLASGYSE